MADAPQDDVIAQLKAKAEEKKRQNEEAAEMEGFTAAKPTHESEKGKEPTFNLKVYSPYKIYYDEEARSVSAVNDTGPFDVLPGHKNFLTLISKGQVVVRNYRGEEPINVVRGVLHVKNNEVTVFLDV